MSESTDRDLVQRAQRGDAAAIGDLFSRYWRAARAAAFGITGEFASAEDAAADAFRHALTALASLRDPDRFGAWLRTIVVRKARASRSHPSMADASAAGLADQDQLPDAALLQHEVAVLVQQASRELPEPLREAVALVYFEGYDTESAARFLDIPAGTLRRRLHDGRVRLRAMVQQFLQEGRPGNAGRERQIEALQSMLDHGEIFQALRGALILRPPPRALIDRLRRRQWHPQDFPSERLRQVVLRSTQPSARLSDPTHPVGRIAVAIRNALPQFQEWRLPAPGAALSFMAAANESRDPLPSVLPPGFAEGRPGSFLRATRAVVCSRPDGRVYSIYEHLRDSPDERAFREAKHDLRLSDVLDLLWMTTGPLELRSVQELLERLCSTILPRAHVQFAPYDEPRYRSALQLQLGQVLARAASGGVLAHWPGCPAGTHAAHLRLFLEPWGTLQCGQLIALEPL